MTFNFIPAKSFKSSVFPIPSLYGDGLPPKRKALNILFIKVTILIRALNSHGEYGHKGCGADVIILLSGVYLADAFHTCSKSSPTYSSYDAINLLYT